MKSAGILQAKNNVVLGLLTEWLGLPCESILGGIRKKFSKKRGGRIVGQRTGFCHGRGLCKAKSARPRHEHGPVSDTYNHRVITDGNEMCARAALFAGCNFSAATAAAFQESLSDEPVLIVTALLTVYIVLGILYESFVHPITILSTLPSAGVGALLALLVTGRELNVMGLIGIILLIGIVKKNAIMMIDFALDAERREGKSPQDAIFEACMLRFRPILMTTMAALLGALH